MSEEDCERLVSLALKNSPVISLLISALERSGCPFNPLRHLSCERCRKGLAGGYDRQTNQIVLCTDYCRDLDRVSRTLTHELVHMYDYCTAVIDFNNLDQLACTEVRAANLADCKGYISSLLQENSSIGVREAQGSCVRQRAVRSAVFRIFLT